MFSFGKAVLGSDWGHGTEADVYDGTGIWFRCGECDRLHRVNETEGFRSAIETQAAAIAESSQALCEAFGMGDPRGRSDVLPEEARFTFTGPDGRRAHARYGVVGSWNPETRSWLWAWGFPRGWTPEPALRIARRLQALGVTRGWQALTEPSLYLDQHEAWHMAQLAAHMAGFPLVQSMMVNEKNRHFLAIDRPVWLT